MRLAARLGLVVCLVWVANLLAPAGAIAQGGTQSPGPCDDGWVAPTPTVLAVTSVPITVPSTEDDYFVLYVKHDRGSGTIVNVPVSVTRGESGTTTLPDNLAPLAADKYQVEKYLVSNPADIDGDCVDDITELNNFGRHNPTNPAKAVPAERGSVALKDRAAFEKLSYQGDGVADRWLRYVEFVKFNVANIDTDQPKVWFQNTDVYRAHWSFLWAALQDVVNCCWSGEAKGDLIYYPNGVAPDGSLGVYLWEFQSYNSFAFREVSIVHEALATAMPFLKGKLVYYPFVSERATTKYNQQKALYDASRVDIMSEDDIPLDTTYIVYNEAESYGLLNVFKPGTLPGPRDVAILSVLPNDLPRAAGAITTMPQTPLSHVNLRAIQNGTPNAFVRDALIDKAVTDLLGKYVYYRTTADGFTLRAATKSEVDAHHSVLRPQQTQTLQRNLSKTTITALANVSFADWTAFGVKAANVAELSKLTSLATGVAPDGFAIPFYFYDEFMKQATVSKETILGKKTAPTAEKITLPIGTTLASAVTQMLAHSKFQTDDDIQEEMLDDLRKAIKNATSPTWIITALTTMHNSFPEGTSLRYRSSTNNEDLSDFNGAGLYDSKTQDPDETVDEGIDKSVKAVWASLWNHRAFLERDFYRVDHTTVAMGVLVHPNYSDEKVNGVAISYDPVSNRNGYYYLNSQVGENLVTNPETNSLPEALLLDPSGAATVLARSNLATASNLLMTDAQMIQLRNSLKAIHDHFKTLYNPGVGVGFAIEIEFKITAQNKLAIKQARPWVFSQPLFATSSKISIVPGSDVTEGGDATFTLTASPKPVASIDVTVDITQSGDFVTTGSQMVTITSSGTATLTVPTGNDSVEETDGSVTATISSGTGYSISNSNGAATVAIADDDTLPPCTTLLIVDGTTQGEWTNSCKSFAPGRDLARYYTFQITQRGLVSINLTSSHDTYLYLRQGKGIVKGTSLYRNDDIGNGNYNSGITRTLNAGWYTIEATTFHGGRTGPFQLEISGLPAATSGPEISIAAGADITEGGSATFTINATPNPSADLDVTVEVSQTGDYASTGTQTVTIPTTGSHTLTVTTTDDANDEADGSVTATISTGTDYTISSSASAATVAVSDDDAPTLPEISIAADGDVTEGTDASYTLTATPKPEADLDVTVEVTQSGDFVTTGSQTVTITSSGTATLSVPTTNDNTSESDGSVTATISAGTDYTVSTNADSATVAVSDDDSTQLRPQEVIDTCVSDSVLTTVRRYYDANKDRAPNYGRNWKRVLFTFRDVEDSQLTPFTAAEALAGEQQWFGWKPVREALDCIEEATTPPPPPDPEISIAAGSAITEGSDATFTVTATPAPTSALTISLTVSQIGSFGPTTGADTVTIPTTGSATFTVSTTNDSTDEPDGSVTATLSTGTGYTVSGTGNAATVSVSDDDDAPPATPVISIAAGSGVTEGSDATFTVTASPAPTTALTISVSIFQSGDYVTSGTRSVTIPSSGTKTFAVTTTDDSVDEADGSVTATISSGTGYTVSSSASTATVAVSDNDDAQLALQATIDSCVSNSLLATVRRYYDANKDRAPSYGRNWKRVLITFRDVQDSQLTPFTAAEALAGEQVWFGWKPVREALECIEEATAPPPPPPPPSDPEISISAGNAVTEGSDATFTVTATPTPATTLTVNLTVSQSGSFGATTGTDTVTIPTTGSAIYTVSTTNDSTDEPDGSVTATLSTGTGYTVSGSKNAATVAVSDDDDPPPATPTIRIVAGSGVTEGSDATFTVTASPAPATALTVNLTVSQSGSFGATTGADTVTIPTTGSATFTVSTTNDSTDEPDGSVTATLSTGSGYTVSGSNNAATVAVSDDDDPPPAPPTISIAAGSGVTEGSDATFTVTANPAPATALTVNLTVSQSGSFGATTGADTVTIPTTGSATFTVSTTNDNTDELDGSVTATLSTGTGYTVSGSSNAATVAVSDNDDPQPVNLPTLSISDAQEYEDYVLMEFYLQLSYASSVPVTVTIEFEEGTATYGGDFLGIDTTQTIAPGQTRKALYVPLRADGWPEVEETFAIKLTSATGATIADDTGIGIIINDD